MKISKATMAKKLSTHVTAKTIANVLQRLTRGELEMLMFNHGFSITTNLCEGCGNIVTSWYDHDENCKLR